jgi:DHA1 family multidrug resistance protein-like MFS transporter
MKLFGGPRLLLSVIGVSFLFILSSGVTGALRPLFFVEAGADPVQLGLLMAVPSLVSVLTRVPSSALSRRLGRWRMMLFSLVVSLVSTALFAFVYDPALFFPLVSLAALSWAIYSPITVEFVSDLSTPSTRGSTMGLYFTSIGAALFVGPLISSVLTVFMSLRQLFLVTALIPLAALLVFLAVTRPGDIDERRVNKDGQDNDPIGGSLSRIFRTRGFAALCVARIAYAMSMGVFSTAYPVYAEAGLGFSASAISILFSFRGVTNVLVRMPAGRLSDRIGRRKPFVAAYALAILIFALLAYVRSFGLLIVVMALYGIAWGMRVAPSTALASESVADEDRPLALAVYMTMFDVGSTIGALLVGFTSAVLDSPALLLLCSPVMASALVVFVLFSKQAEEA